MFGENLPKNDYDYSARLFALHLDRVPAYLIEKGMEFFGMKGPANTFPQLGIACHLNAALINALILKILNGEDYPSFPTPTLIDLKEQLEIGK